MPVHTDVMRLVMILDEEGFGALAGELLMEINLGRELQVGDGDFGLQLSAGPFVEQDSLPETAPREPIPEADQFSEAISFLRLRLVEPVQRLLQADQIAQSLSDQAGSRTQRRKTQSMIEFVASEGTPVPDFARRDPSSERESAEALDSLLNRMLSKVS